MRRLVALAVPVLMLVFLAGPPLAAAAAGALDQYQNNTSENGWVWDSHYIHAQTFTAGLTGTLDTV